MTQKMNWDKAEKHVREILKQYEGLVGMPGVNPFFGIAVLQKLLWRFTNGERTELLHKEMMAVE